MLVDHPSLNASIAQDEVSDTIFLSNQSPETLDLLLCCRLVARSKDSMSVNWFMSSIQCWPDVRSYHELFQDSFILTIQVRISSSKRGTLMGLGINL